MIEYLAPGFIYALIKDAWAMARGRRRRLSPVDIIERRQKWKLAFEAKLSEWHRKGLSQDVIIRDMKRIDSYPDIDPSKKGISPWFRVGLVDTYHRGILVGLGWGSLTQDAATGKWRSTNTKAKEAGDIKVLLVGKVPFENIEAVDWDGDEFYHKPHIYCFFDARKRQPYEDLVYCTEQMTSTGRPFYSDVAPYQEVRKLTKKRGISEYE
jgi:hypothetical protein